MNEEEQKNFEMTNDKTQESHKNDRKAAERPSYFKIICIILIVLFCVAIIVQIGVLIWLQSETNNLKNKNDKIPDVQETSCVLSIDQSDDFCDKILINQA